MNIYIYIYIYIYILKFFFVCTNPLAPLFLSPFNEHLIHFDCALLLGSVIVASVVLKLVHHTALT